jgi:hypothetical protein
MGARRARRGRLPAKVPSDASAALQARGGVLLAAASNDGTMLAVATYDAITVFRITRGR